MTRIWDAGEKGDSRHDTSTVDNKLYEGTENQIVWTYNEWGNWNWNHRTCMLQLSIRRHQEVQRSDRCVDWVKHNLEKLDIIKRQDRVHVQKEWKAMPVVAKALKELWCQAKIKIN